MNSPVNRAHLVSSRRFSSFVLLTDCVYSLPGPLAVVLSASHIVDEQRSITAHNCRDHVLSDRRGVNIEDIPYILRGDKRAVEPANPSATWTGYRRRISEIFASRRRWSLGGPSLRAWRPWLECLDSFSPTARHRHTAHCGREAPEVCLLFACRCSAGLWSPILRVMIQPSVLNNHRGRETSALCMW